MTYLSSCTRTMRIVWLISLQFCTANHGMLCCVCWKWRDWPPDILSSRPDSCNSRGKSRRNRKGIFTVCPTAVYLTAASSLGSCSRRHRPRHPGRCRRRSNIAGKRVAISSIRPLITRVCFHTLIITDCPKCRAPIHRSCNRCV